MALKLTTRLSFDSAPNGVDSEVTLLASLEAPQKEETESETVRKPIDLVVALDKSGSMEGEKLELCKKTLKFLIEEAVTANDFFGLVTFDSNVYKDFEGGKMTHENKNLALSRVEKIRSGSCTNLSGGLFQALEMLKTKSKSDVSAVCILTDGLMNNGITNRAELLLAVKNAIAEFPKDRPAPSVFCFGYGLDADGTMLRMLAEGTGATYYSIENPEAVPLAFADCLGGLVAVAAQNIELTCDLANLTGKAEFAADPYTKFPFEKISATSYRLKIKDMYYEERRDLLFRIKLLQDTKNVPTMVNAVCKYIDTLHEQPGVAKSSITITRYPGTAAPTGPVDVEVFRHWLRTEAARALDQARVAAESGSTDKGKNIVRYMMEMIKFQMQKMHLELKNDAMIDEVMDDLNLAAVNLTSNQSYVEHGRSQMESASFGHMFQRSNKVQTRDFLSEPKSSPYEISSKMAMKKSTKSAFGWS